MTCDALLATCDVLFCFKTGGCDVLFYGEKKESDTNSTDAVGAPEELVKAAKEEGKLIVYGSCEEEYLNAVCANFKSRKQSAYPLLLLPLPALLVLQPRL